MKKKVLFLTIGFNVGGTEKATFDIITHLNPEKYDITLMSMYGGGYFWNQLPKYVHTKYFFPKFIRYVIRYVTLAPPALVYRTFIHDKYDIEVACGDNIPSRIINHSTNQGSKKIAWIHMDVIERGYRGYEMKTQWGRKRFYQNFDAIVNVSKECERKFIQKFGADLPTCTIYNVIDSDNIRRLACEEPTLYLKRECFNIVCIGRFTDQKGFDRLIEAYSSVKPYEVRNSHITILGDGQDRECIEMMAKDKQVADAITFAGYVTNPYSVLAQADLFLLSSRDESFALVVAEAMTLGIPVMSTRCTGPVELLRDGEAGMLVENSTEGIRDGLYKILTSNTVYEEMKLIADANRDNFHLKQQMAQIEALFDT